MKIKYNKKRYSKEILKSLYFEMLKPRLIEEKMLKLLRQGKISKWFSGIGQEAISVGCTMALDDDEKIFPMHRNLGVFTSRKIPLDRLFCQWQGKETGFTKGRDRSFHFGAPEYHIIGMISHLGPQLSLAAGVSLSHLINKRQKVALAFTGEGGTSQGEFHEALNVASVWKLPVIFVIENNGYGLSTPSQDQYACKSLVDRARGYGMKSVQIDGNNVLEVYDTIRSISKKIRKNNEPYLVECMTFRMRGHEEASGTKYVPNALMEEWAQKDPISNYESFLKNEGVLTEEDVEVMSGEIKKDIDASLAIAYDTPEVEGNQYKEESDVYAEHVSSSIRPIEHEGIEDKRFIDAISDGLSQAMIKYPELILMGQDIAEYGGVFKVTEGFYEKFGAERVRNTPLCESAIIGIAMGATLEGSKAMVEMQFADFVTCGFNQIVNNLAKVHYRWGHAPNVVIRMPTGAGVGAGPFHSQSNEAWFTHTPGLKVVYPSNPEAAKGLLLAAFEDPNPVLFFEHKAMYRNISGKVPNSYYTYSIGSANCVSSGNDLSIITYGMGVHWALEKTEKMGVDAEIIDLQTLSPIDYASIDKTVKKTNRVIILHEDTRFGGIGGDLSAYISEHLFEYLDAPVKRVTSLDTPIPFAANLERVFLASNRLEEAIQELLDY